MNIFKFPMGEIHFKYDNTCPKIVVIDEIENVNDALITAALLVGYLGNEHPTKQVFLPYFPYARQDRQTSLQEPSSFFWLAERLFYDTDAQLYCFDLHNPVAAPFSCEIENITIDRAFQRFPGEYPLDMLIVPDHGAIGRCNLVRKHFKAMAIASKTRNVETGALTFGGISYPDDLPTGKHCWIVDDICDGGGTFIPIIKQLYEDGAKTVSLYVSHGGFTKGLQPLIDAGITSIVTTSSLKSAVNLAGDLVKIIPCKNLLEAHDE